jgi:hypothetical protein
MMSARKKTRGDLHIVVSIGAVVIRRGLASIVLATTLSAFVAAEEVAAQRTFDVSGTIIAARGAILTIVTSDVTGQAQPIMVDVSLLKTLQFKVGDPIALTIRPREFDTYLALGVVGQSPFVNGQDFGVLEEFTTRDDSIQARVGNVPEDDEALAKKDGDDEDDDDEDNDDDRRRR